jgi:hypothetical protein
MTWFMIRMEGSGLSMSIPRATGLLWKLLPFRRKIICTGLYATRYAEADDADTAIEFVRSILEKELIEVLIQNGGVRDGFAWKVDEVKVADPRDVDSNAKGFTFFQE